MKNTKKFVSVLLALLAVFMFASCADDDEETSAPSVVATFYGTTTINIPDDNGTAIPCILQMTLRCYNNNEYVTHFNIAAVTAGTIATMDYDDEIGTYTGDPTKNGVTIKATSKKEYDVDTKKWVDVTIPTVQTLSIATNGKITITETDDDGSDMTIILTRQ